MPNRVISELIYIVAVTKEANINKIGFKCLFHSMCVVNLITQYFLALKKFKRLAPTEEKTVINA